MAGDNPFPQIPSTVWTGVWALVRKSPKRRLDDNVLAIELNVQPTAAKAYARELNRLGILKPDGTPTDLAHRWCQDGDDPEIILEILRSAYPDELLQLAPPDDLDRAKIIRWFMGKKLGEGAAKNKAATYMRLATGVSRSETSSANGSTSDTPPPKARKAAARSPETVKEQRPPPGGGGGRNPGGRPDVHINVQIHIAADATPDQIDAIFAAMRKYFD